MRTISLKIMLSKIFKKENRLYLYLCLVFIAIIFLGLSASKWTSAQQIKKFIVSGNSIIPTNELLSLIDFSVINNIKDDIDLIDVKNKIEGHKFVAASYIMRKNPSVIEIEISERMPVALILKPDGSLIYTDRYSILLPYRLSLSFDEIPIVRGLYKNSVIDSSALINAVALINELKKEKNEILYQLVSEIKYSSSNKSFEIITADKAYNILFGKSEYLKEKINICCDFLADAIFDIDINKLEYIDIRWKNRVIVKCSES